MQWNNQLGILTDEMGMPLTLQAVRDLAGCCEVHLRKTPEQIRDIALERVRGTFMEGQTQDAPSYWDTGVPVLKDIKDFVPPKRGNLNREGRKPKAVK